jgi:hypothetical protein
VARTMVSGSGSDCQSAAALPKYVFYSPKEHWKSPLPIHSKTLLTHGKSVLRRSMHHAVQKRVSQSGTQRDGWQARLQVGLFDSQPDGK